MSANESRMNWKQWLNYPSLVRQLPFILYLTSFGVLYIYNGHWANKTIRNIQLAEKEIRELQYEYVTAKGELLARSKPSEVSKAVAPLGLKELVKTPWILIDSNTNQSKRSN
ncbi:MAG: FtsL-like putative cell division protein [Bacteroidota bacterium]